MLEKIKAFVSMIEAADSVGLKSINDVEKNAIRELMNCDAVFNETIIAIRDTLCVITSTDATFITTSDDTVETHVDVAEPDTNVTVVDTDHKVDINNEWRLVKNKEGFTTLEVSTLGVVRHKGRIVRPFMTGGQLVVELTTDLPIRGKIIRRQYRVRRLVVETFLLPEGKTIRSVTHKNQCVTDCRVENLDVLLGDRNAPMKKTLENVSEPTIEHDEPETVSKVKSVDVVSTTSASTILKLLDEGKSIEEIAASNELITPRDVIRCMRMCGRPISDEDAEKYMIEEPFRKMSDEINDIENNVSDTANNTTSNEPESEPEEWRELNKDGITFEVSSLGKVRTSDDCIIRPMCYKNGLTVRLKTIDNKTITFRVDRLVAEAFLPEPGLRIRVMSIYHKNFDLTDCRAENLMWIHNKKFVGVNDLTDRVVETICAAFVEHHDDFNKVQHIVSEKHAIQVSRYVLEKIRNGARPDVSERYFNNNSSCIENMILEGFNIEQICSKNDTIDPFMIAHKMQDMNKFGNDDLWYIIDHALNRNFRHVENAANMLEREGFQISLADIRTAATEIARQKRKSRSVVKIV